MSGEGFGPHVSVVIARYAPRSLTPPAGVFVREVVTRAAPATPGRAKALLFAAAGWLCLLSVWGLSSSRAW